MDPITLIVAALVAGATTGALDSVKDGAKAAYGKVRALVQKRIAGDRGAETALAELADDPETWQVPLAKRLTQLGAADDKDLVDAAQQLMELVDSAGAQAGKYNVIIKNAKGVQIGDHNTQHNTF